jgi:hypothetical protein
MSCRPQFAWDESPTRVPISLVVEDGLHDSHYQEQGARVIEKHLHFRRGSVVLRGTPLISGDGFPNNSPRGREYVIEHVRAPIRLILADSGTQASHVLAWRVSSHTRLLVPMPARNRLRRLLDLVGLYDREASANRIDEELSEIFQTLLPYRTSMAKFLKALRAIH